MDVGFLAFLVGVIDGDGYIQMRKRSNGYIEFNLVITFNNRDLATFEYILSKLHFGVIAVINSTTSKLVVYNFELKYILCGGTLSLLPFIAKTWTIFFNRK